MIGTIEDLERDIEQFQNNVEVSGELVKLLQKLVEQIKQHNSELEDKAHTLIFRVGDPSSEIEQDSISSNTKIYVDVSAELDKAIYKLSKEQDRYLQELETTKQQIGNCSEQIETQERMSIERLSAIVTMIKEILTLVEEENNKSNIAIKNNVSVVVDTAIQKILLEQEKYLQGLETAKQQITNCVEQMENQERVSIDRLSEIVAMIKEVLASIENENSKNNEAIKTNVSMIVDTAFHDFCKEQDKYVSELKQTREHVEKCENQLNDKYREFVGCLDGMNISNLYEQNIQLKKTLDKKALILMIISGLSVVIGIAGLLI